MSEFPKAVSPSNVNTSSSNIQEDPNNQSGGQFSVNNPNVSSTPIPAANPMVTGQQATGINTNYNLNPPVVQQQQSSSGGGGDIFGSILSIGSKVLPFFLSEGGPVEYANGGQVNPKGEAQKKVGLSIGYLVGAHHQKTYGGTPDTLEKAASEVKNILNEKVAPQQSPQGFADGGMYNQDNTDSNDVGLAHMALLQSLGMANPDQANNNQSITPPTQPINQARQLPIQGQMQPQGQSSNPMLQRARGGYIQHLATGGPPMPQQNMPPQQGPQGPMMQSPGATKMGQAGPPPLGQGQVFQGDGSVKGPGGPQDDAIPAKLSNGEFVFAEPAVQFFGVDKLTKMNEQGKQGFMQALGQVQPQPSGAGPNGPMPPQGSTPQQPPQQIKNGGPITAKRNNGYAGL